MLALQADGADVKTIEGVASNGELHPMQAAFREHHGLQCGFCTPGMIMSALDLVKNNPDPGRSRKSGNGSKAIFVDARDTRISFAQ